MSPLDNPPRKSAKIRRRPSVRIDVEQANCLPPAPRRRPINGRTHTTYKDLVTTLRGKGEATEALVHYQETGKPLGHGLGVVDRKHKQKLAEPRTRAPEANPDDYSTMFEQDTSGKFVNMVMGDYVSEHNKLVQQVRASGEFAKSPERVLFKVDTPVTQVDDATITKTGNDVFGTSTSTPEGPTPFLKNIVERYPYPEEAVRERTDDDYKALFDDLSSPKQSPKK